MLVGRGSDSGRAVAADAGLQKPAGRGAHRLPQSQLVPFTPKARRPATRAIAAKKQRGRQCKRPRPSVFPVWIRQLRASPQAPPTKSCPVSLSWSPAPWSPPLGPRPQPGGMGPVHRNRSRLEIRPVPAVCLVWSGCERV